jgi:hypothetical protein
MLDPLLFTPAATENFLLPAANPVNESRAKWRPVLPAYSTDSVLVNRHRTRHNAKILPSVDGLFWAKSIDFEANHSGGTLVR